MASQIHLCPCPNAGLGRSGAGQEIRWSGWETLTVGSATSIVSELARAGTTVMFGLPGGGPNLDVIGAAEATGMRFVLAHAESAAVIMAATCADLTGTPGAVVVTRGPGLAGAMNGVAHAALDRLPVVVIADTVRAAETDRISHQRLDQEALGRSVAKAVVAIGGKGADKGAVRAVRDALAPPQGPVIALMDDGDAARCAGPGDGRAEPATGSADAGGDSGSGTQDALAFLAEALRGARRPLLLLGAAAIPHTTAIRGALLGSGVPALHTYRARGIVPDRAAEAAGLVTGGTAEWPLLAAADLIIGLGVDEAEMIPAAWEYTARTVLVTGHPATRGESGYFTGASTVAAPLSAAIGVLADNAGGHDWPPGVGRAARLDAVHRLTEAAVAGPGKLAPQRVAAIVRAHTPPDTVATVDAGAHMLVAMPLWEVTQPRRLLTSSGLATMGFALPAAIAAACCAPGPPVVAFTGDGGLGMTLAEIETAVRLQLPIVVIVFNDAALSLIKIKQRPAGHGGAAAVDYRPVSFAAIATAMGAAGASVAAEAELVAALEQALRRNGPSVIDVAVDPACYPAVLELSRGAAGRQPVPGLAPGTQTWEDEAGRRDPIS
jgi:acetolactate synthase I/II/III large subunit